MRIEGDHALVLGERPARLDRERLLPLVVSYRRAFRLAATARSLPAVVAHAIVVVPFTRFHPLDLGAGDR